MTTEEKIRLVEKLISTYRTAYGELDKISEVFGTHDFPFANEFWKLFDLYTDTVSEKIGDKSEWLPWFIYDNNCGDGGMEVTVDGVDFDVCDVKTLIERVIER